MTTASIAVPVQERGWLGRVLVGGALVGACDIGAAILVYAIVLGKTTPVRVLQSVAAGVLGRETYNGGAATAALGLTLHFTIAYCWTIAYFLLYRRLTWLRTLVASPFGPLKAALLWAPVVYLLMNLVVVPLSRARSGPLTLTMLVIHIVAVALPMTLVVREGRTE
jgi:hypothetical protein